MKEPLEEYKPKLDLKPLSKKLPKVFKKVCCPSCDEVVPGTNLNINDKIAKCNQCDIIFPFEAEAASLISKTKITQEVFRPEGIEITHFQDELDISIKQPITLAEWVGIMISMLSPFPIIGYFNNPDNIGVMIIAIALFAILAWTVFNLITRSKHRVYLNIDDQYITRMYRPKKLIKDKLYEIDDIDQLYVKATPNISGVGVFMIINAPEGQKHVNLLAGIDTQSKAKYLEQEIERHLGITNRKVPEEL